MDFDSLLAPVMEFFSHGVGKQIADALWALYTHLYPSNAGPAEPVVVPK
ncbi:hypothetical protein [Corynebacterium poyangense]|nr:hypothetical protein [Corynebacterium poyangense]